MELGQDVVEAAFVDPASAPVSDRVKAALALIERLTLHPDELDGADVDAARAAGLTEAEIADAFDVATLFSLIDRLADAFAWRVLTEDQFNNGAKVILKYGYRFFPRLLWPRP